jgi:aspartate/methionine/tyrosine aminotransferase
MAERAVRVGSAGKTFSFTAWKVGWVTGPADLISAIAKAHQFIVFTVPTPLQKAVAHGLDHETSFYTGLGSTLQAKRSYLQQRLTAIGFKVLPTQGSYFLVANFRPLLPAGHQETDVEFCDRLTKEAGVTVLPVSAFYVSPNPPQYMVRFVFCKTDEKLANACDSLEAYFKQQQQQ